MKKNLNSGNNMATEQEYFLSEDDYFKNFNANQIESIIKLHNGLAQSIALSDMLKHFEKTFGIVHAYTIEVRKYVHTNAILYHQKGIDEFYISGAEDINSKIFDLKNP
jgi:hypothetical protein